LRRFECRDVNRSSLIQRVCYDHTQRYLIVGIRGRYDDYCDLPQQTFDGFMTASSMGQFFNQNIRNRVRATATIAARIGSRIISRSRADSVRQHRADIGLGDGCAIDLASP